MGELGIQDWFSVIYWVVWGRWERGTTPTKSDLGLHLRQGGWVDRVVQFLCQKADPNPESRLAPTNLHPVDPFPTRYPNTRSALTFLSHPWPVRAKVGNHNQLKHGPGMTKSCYWPIPLLSITTAQAIPGRRLSNLFVSPEMLNSQTPHASCLITIALPIFLPNVQLRLFTATI